MQYVKDKKTTLKNIYIYFKIIILKLTALITVNAITPIQWKFLKINSVLFKNKMPT